MTDVLSKSQRKFCMSRIRGKDTKPELLLRKKLWAKGLRYRLKINLTGKPDIVFPAMHLAIFVDGCFWHGCPEHCQMPEANRAFWEEKLLKNKARDQEVNLVLIQQGWKVLRFWEHEIKTGLSECVERISQALRKSGIRHNRKDGS